MLEPIPSGAGAGVAERTPPRGPERLARGITWVLVAKVAALALLYAVFFSPAHRPDITPGHVAEALLTPAAAGPPAPPSPFIP